MRAFITPKNKVHFLPTYALLSAIPGIEPELIRRTYCYSCRPEITLLQAARRGELEIVRYKIEVENALKTNSGLAQEVLGLAVNRGHLELVKYLNNRGIKSPYCMSIAARGNHWDIVEYFIRCEDCGYYNWNAVLEKGAQHGNKRIVQLCLREAGRVDLHAMDDFALRMSSERGFHEIVALLLQHGANVHAGGEYALVNACRSGHYEVVVLLLNYGADVHWHDCIALRVAAREGYLPIVKLLVEWGSDVHALADDAFCKAVDNAHLNVVKYLVEECGVNPLVNRGYGLRWALLYKYADLEAYLRTFSQV